MRERELSDNMALRKKQEYGLTLQDKTEKLSEELGGLDVTRLDRERKELINQRDDLESQVKLNRSINYHQ